ncbi:MAG: glycosyltransferase involved in cell wall biosynthesis [Candidatus Marinamargulisbacteria bacterium]
MIGTKRALKIGIVHPTFEILGGAENVVFWFAESFVKRGHSVHVISAGFSLSAKQQFEKIGVSVIDIKTPFIPAYDQHRRNLWIMGLRLRPYLKQFDVINAHNFPATLWIGYAAKFEKRNLPPLIWTCHEPPRSLFPKALDLDMYQVDLKFDPNNRPFITKVPKGNRDFSNGEKAVKKRDFELVTQMVSKVVCNSEFTAGQVRSLYHIEPTVHYFGIPQIQRGKTTPPVKDMQDAVLGLLFVSRVEIWKNCQGLLMAMETLKNRLDRADQQVHLHIVGTGSFLLGMKSLAEELDISTLVTFHGFLSDEALAGRYRKSHVLAYLPIEEPMGLVPMEAGLLGLPTLGSNSGGPAEIVLDGKTGRLADPQDPVDIADKIEWMMNHRDEVAIMGQQARARILDFFDHRKNADRFESLLYEMVDLPES